MSDSLWPCGLYSPWHSPGQNTRVGSLFLLQGIFPIQGRTQVSLIAGRFFTSWATRAAQLKEVRKFNWLYKQWNWNQELKNFWFWDCCISNPSILNSHLVYRHLNPEVFIKYTINMSFIVLSWEKQDFLNPRKNPSWALHLSLINFIFTWEIPYIVLVCGTLGIWPPGILVILPSSFLPCMVNTR